MKDINFKVFSRIRIGEMLLAGKFNKLYSFCHNRNLPLAIRKQWWLLSATYNYFACRNFCRVFLQMEEW